MKTTCSEGQSYLIEEKDWQKSSGGVKKDKNVSEGTCTWQRLS